MRRRRLVLVLLAALVVVVAGAGVTLGRFLLTRGTSTPIDLGDVEDRYYASTTTTLGAATTPPAPTGVPGNRATPTTPPAPTSAPPAGSGAGTPAPATAPATEPPTTAPAAAPVLPGPGVYVYATTGGDRIDALGGDHHDYPATTTITVTASGCGVLQRWDVIEERWETWQRCGAADGDGVVTSARSNYDEFFGRGVQEDATCDGDARPLAAPAGTTWTVTCTSADGGNVQTLAGTVVGDEPRQVGGAEVTTLHVTVTVTDTADARDLQVIDTWYLAGTDLLVAQHSTDHSVNSSPVGDVDYDEEYAIELTQLAPVAS